MCSRTTSLSSVFSSASEADSIIALQREIVAQRLKQEGKVPPSTKKPLVDNWRMHHTPSSSRVEYTMKSGYAETLPTSRPQLVAKAKTRPYNIQTPRHLRNKKVPDDDTLSVSTATITVCTRFQDHQTPPLHLPTFKPAVGCISADAFLIRCFVARMRKGVTVTKHSRSKFQKASREYILQLENDNETLTWRPCTTDSTNARKSCSKNNHSKRWHLAECQEVRIASSMDPEYPAYLGTSILREKCNTADAHKSFALVFPQRSLDFTSATADQCKMLIEGFSALCYQLHRRKGQTNLPHETEDQICERDEDVRRKGCFIHI